MVVDILAVWPDYVVRAECVLSRSLEILTDLEPAWPRASRWTSALMRSANSLRITARPEMHIELVAPSAGARMPEHVGQLPLSGHDDESPETQEVSRQSEAAVSFDALSNHGISVPPSEMVSEYLDPSLENVSGTPGSEGTHPDHSFEAELSQFLHGDAQYGILSDWGPEQAFY